MKIKTHKFEAHSKHTLATRLGVSEDEITRLLASGRLTPVRQVGPTSWKFSASEIDALKEAL